VSEVFLLSGDGTKIPYEENVLRQMVGRGQVAATTLYWRQGMAEWRPMAEFIAGLNTPAQSFPARSVQPGGRGGNAAGSPTQSPLELARATQVMLILYVLASVLLVYGAAGQMLFVFQTHIDLRAAREHDTLMSFLARTSLVIYVATSVPFLMWIYLVAENARKLAGPLTYSSGYAVGSFFIPFICLVHPCVAMQEIWKASGHPRNWRQQGNSYLVGFWWTFWMLTAFFGWSLLWLPKVHDRDSLQLTTTFLLLLELVKIVLSALALALVQGITSRQMRLLRAPATDPGQLP
jgi:hypothetical protein